MLDLIPNSVHETNVEKRSISVVHLASCSYFLAFDIDSNVVGDADVRVQWYKPGCGLCIYKFIGPDNPCSYLKVVMIQYMNIGSRKPSTTALKLSTILD